MLKAEQLKLLKEKYNSLLDEFTKLYNDNPDDYKFVIRWLNNDIRRIDKEINSNKRNIYNYKSVTITLPIELEEKAKENAKSRGFIKGGEGVLSPYIVYLMDRDLENKELLFRKLRDVKDLDFSSKYNQKKNVLYLTLEQQEKARERALELGFIHGAKGNISQYVRFLIALDSVASES